MFHESFCESKRVKGDGAAARFGSSRKARRVPVCYRFLFETKRFHVKAEVLAKRASKAAENSSKTGKPTEAANQPERRYASFDEEEAPVVARNTRWTDENPAEAREPAAVDMRGVFGPGGLLERSMIGGYEHRVAQLEMAEVVHDAFQTRHHAIVEAGTGTGKTLAYLLPAICSGRRVVISTATKSLQEQLYQK